MGEIGAITPPAPLREQHDIERFSSGEAALDLWLRRRARANDASGASRTYVVCAGQVVVGYYALAAGAIATDGATGRFRRNMPDPIPVAILARLAVDHGHQGRGIGRGLVRDAVLRVAQAAEVIGIRGIAVHAISENAKRFHVGMGFDPSQSEPMLLLATLADIASAHGL